MKIQVMTFPFGECGEGPTRCLEDSKHEISYVSSRVLPEEVAQLIEGCDAIVAGTEPYTKAVLDGCPNLKVISRVGVGVDSVDLAECKARGIVVTYTPEAPADGVAELAVAQILNLLRGTRLADQSVREGRWDRRMGSLVRENVIGILGVGRIGKRVARLLQPFRPVLFGCDLAPDNAFASEHSMTWTTLDNLFHICDLVSIHVPLNRRNRHLVGRDQILRMFPGGFLVNTARGPIVDTGAVIEALRSGRLAGYAADVFDEEPYRGPLVGEPNAFLTPHIGSCASKCRNNMEMEAVLDCLNVLAGGEPFSPVPEELTDEA